MSQQTYPCDQCGKPRTKAEGGTVFTVCDECWPKPSEQKIQPATDPLLTSADAQVWAREFMRIWSGRWHEVDEGLMIAWFANAIMRGFDESAKRDREKIAALEESHQELICLLSIIDMGDGDCLNEYGRSFESVQMLTKILAENAKMRKALEMIARSTPMDMEAVLVAREALK